MHPTGPARQPTSYLLVRLLLHQLLPSPTKAPDKIGDDPDNPQPANGDTLTEYSQLPLQPKHMSNNSVGDVCKSKHPTIEHLLVPRVLNKFYGSFTYRSRKATNSYIYEIFGLKFSLSYTYMELCSQVFWDAMLWLVPHTFKTD